MSLSESKIVRENPIQSLNDNEEAIVSIGTREFIYIKHIDNEKVFAIPEMAASRSKLLKDFIIDGGKTDNYGMVPHKPMIISNYTFNTFEFTYNYLMYHNGKNESYAPESPLKNIHISTILGDEYTLFDNLVDENSDLKSNLIKINDHIETSMYFGCVQLTKKLCAVVASLLSNADINTLNKLK